MAIYRDDSKPVVIREREVVRERDDADDVQRDTRRKNSATPWILLGLLALVILGYMFFRYNPFASGKSTNVNVNVPTPTLNRN